MAAMVDNLVFQGKHPDQCGHLATWVTWFSQKSWLATSSHTCLCITEYPLVNVYITIERSTIFNGKIHYFYGIFSTAMLVYQRVTARAEAVCMRGSCWHPCLYKLRPPFQWTNPQYPWSTKTGRWWSLTRNSQTLSSASPGFAVLPNTSWIHLSSMTCMWGSMSDHVGASMHVRHGSRSRSRSSAAHDPSTKIKGSMGWFSYGSKFWLSIWSIYGFNGI